MAHAMECLGLALEGSSHHGQYSKGSVQARGIQPQGLAEADISRIRRRIQVVAHHLLGWGVYFQQTGKDRGCLGGACEEDHTHRVEGLGYDSGLRGSAAAAGVWH